jgi:hypothetical protein
MKPIDFLGKVEPIVIGMFDSVNQADIRSYSIREVFEPQKRHYAYIFSHRQLIEEYDDETLNHYYGKVAEAHQELLLINIASAAAAGAILQIARQCISMTWRSYNERMDKGKVIGSQKLSKIIWHSRNQALHFEEGTPTNDSTRACIEKIAEEFGLNIDDLDKFPRSLAREILGVLSWDKYEQFAIDIVQMLEEP